MRPSILPWGGGVWYGVGMRLSIMVMWVAAAMVVGAAPADDAFAAVWREHRALTNDHDRAITVFREALARRNADGSAALGRYAPIVQTLEGWRWVAKRNTAEAERAFTAALMTSGSRDAAANAADWVARRWLTRLDRERVVEALKAYYGSNVIYPDTLAGLSTLPPDKQPPKTDRFGKAWQYSPAAMRRIRVGANQTYTLTSAELKESSALKDFFTKAYPSPAMAFRPSGQGAVEVRGELGGARGQGVGASDGNASGGMEILGIIREGMQISGFQLATVDADGRFAIITDGDFWFTALQGGR